MSRHPQVYPWAQEIATRLPALNPALAMVLALWSVGMVLTKRSGLDSVTQQLTSLLGQSFNTVRQRLRDAVLDHVLARHRLEGDDRVGPAALEFRDHPPHDVRLGVEADDRIAQRHDERLVAD